MRNKVLKFGFVIAVLAVMLSACRKENDADAGGTSMEKMAGVFWVQIKYQGTPLVPDYFKIITYNTSDNSTTKMWLDDQGHIWPFKFKVDVDLNSQTFSANNAASEYSNITVKLANGKLLTGVTMGPASKAKTDSIYFEAEFSDDPGTTYQFAGYRRTGWPEDDH
ncbi:MAG TPA: lipid-binding protein [Chitinophagaceae bacterium]|nr:lipid-binding protein [Chitinophagaceae bacterium]